jgi:hypothetical protein
MPGMVVGDITSRRCFTWLLSLPTWGLMWTGYPTPYTVLWHVAVRQEDWASCQALSCPIIAVGRWRLFGGCEAPRIGYLVEY